MQQNQNFTGFPVSTNSGQELKIIVYVSYDFYDAFDRKTISPGFNNLKPGDIVYCFSRTFLSDFLQQALYSCFKLRVLAGEEVVVRKFNLYIRLELLVFGNLAVCSH